MNRIHTLVALAGAVVISACSSSSAETGSANNTTGSTATATPAHRTLYIIGVDVSSSFADSAHRSQAQAIVDGVINQMNYGDVLTMVETFKSGTNAVGAWSDTAPELHFASPTAYEKTQLAHFRSKARAIAGGFVYPKTAANSTDLLATVQRASDYAAPALLHKDRVNLLLVSDMMNYSNELKMTGLASIPDSAWVARRKTDGLVPELPGVCVSVAGADVSNHTGIAVRTFWQRYFAAAGASLDKTRYLTLMASPSQVLC